MNLNERSEAIYKLPDPAAYLRQLGNVLESLDRTLQGLDCEQRKQLLRHAERLNIMAGELKK